MKNNDLEARLRNSLEAEQRRVRERFASDAELEMPGDRGTAVEQPAVPGTTRAEADAGPAPVAPLEDPPRTYDTQIEALVSRYLRIGFNPSRDQVIRAGLLALDQLPGADLRKLMASVPGVHEDENDAP